MKLLPLLAFLCIATVGCTSAAPDPRTQDVPTRGDVLILADEDFRTILESERRAFENVYTDATVRITYLPEAELLQQMLNDSVRVVFTTCLPGAQQEAYFRTRRLSPDAVPVLTDGIAVMRSPMAAVLPITTQTLLEQKPDSNEPGMSQFRIPYPVRRQ